MEDIETTIKTRAFFKKTKERLLKGLRALPPFRRRLFVVALLLFVISSFLLIVKQSDRYLIEVPRSGGSLTEGIIGRPRFINPVIAKSDADRDMSELIYSGLLRATTEGGLVPDLASGYDVSPDGLTYTFTLRPNPLWHDGEAITSADVAFTIDDGFRGDGSEHFPPK